MMTIARTRGCSDPPSDPSSIGAMSIDPRPEPVAAEPGVR
jgi:hypothetical protein